MAKPKELVELRVKAALAELTDEYQDAPQSTLSKQHAYWDRQINGGKTARHARPHQPIPQKMTPPTLQGWRRREPHGAA